MKKFVVAIAILSMVILLAVFRPWVPKARADNRALRHAPAGDVIGFADQHATFAWLGVPFAQAPVGDLRWRAPRPLSRWRNVRPVLAMSPPCAQFKILALLDKHATTGSEDCLYLNIWTPHMTADEATGKRLPVMVWIHGGGDTMGLAEATPGSHLAGAEQVVVVSLQYRLGIFGWFSHPALRSAAATPADASSNFGLLDMIAGLRWVHDLSLHEFLNQPWRGQPQSRFHMVMAATLSLLLPFERGILKAGALHREMRSHYYGDPGV